MTRLLVLLAALVLLAVAGAGSAAGEAADTAAAPFFSWAYWQQEGDSGTSRSEVFRNFGLFVVAVIALGFGIWRAVTGYMQARASQRQAEAANDQARIAQQGHITERFSRAVEQLGHDRVAVRIGGLYALKRIAEDSVERDHLVVMDVLSNFIRQPPYTNEQREAAEREIAWRPFRTKSAEEKADSNQNAGADQIADGAAPPPEPELIDCPDIAAAIEIIQGRIEDQKAVEKKREYRLSLSRASLSYLRLPEVDLHTFDLAFANLMGADLISADLTGADLMGANLMGANLMGAKLRNANLSGANLAGATLIVADLKGANLAGANLTGANLTSAQNLTQDQLDSACIREGGEPPALPHYVNQPAPWNRWPAFRFGARPS